MEQKTILSVKDRWDKPVNRIGVFTIILCIIATFIPSLYLNIRYGAWAGWDALKSAFAICVIYFGINWFIEPVSYYPALGNAGSYLSWLAGSCAQQRIPAAITAKTALGVEDGSQEAEIVSVTAICGSIVINVIVLTLTAILGSLVLKILPAAVTSALTTYLLPGMFGALLAMFGCSAPLLTIPVFIVMVAINVCVSNGLIGLPSWSVPLIAIVGTICYARLLYKKGKLGPKKKKEA